MILFTSDTKKYIGLTLFCIIFALIYEQFSHGVSSIFMIFSFMIPLLLGVIPSYIIQKNKIKNSPIYFCSVLTLMFGSIFKGVLDIYGTTNTKVYIYLVAGIILLIFGIIDIIKEKNKRPTVK